MARVTNSAASDPERLIAGVLRVADILVVVLAGYLAYVVRGPSPGAISQIPTPYLVALVLGGLLTANFQHLAQVYRPDLLRYPLAQVTRTVVAWFAVILALLVLSVLTQSSAIYSRIWLALWVVFGMAGLMLLRGIAMARVSVMQTRGKLLKRMAVVGTGPLAREVAQQLRADGSFAVVGFVETDDTGCSVPREEVVARLEDLDAALRRLQIEELLITVPWGNRTAIEKIMQGVRGFPVNVRLCPELPAADLPLYGFSQLAGLPVLDVWRRPLSPWELLVKSLEDKIVGAFLLVLCAPLMLVIALAIKLDSPGPALFRQRRAGFSNDTFDLLKFRTMYHAREPEHDVPQARRNDPRVTPVGRLLRRSSMDELPQLFNVLRGEMSLVGPRPHALEHDTEFNKLIADYLARQRVKPGITGWAQINGLRGETDTPEKLRRRVQADLYYIENWSLLLDLKIIFLTPFVALVHRNAY